MIIGMAGEFIQISAPGDALCRARIMFCQLDVGIRPGSLSELGIAREQDRHKNGKDKKGKNKNAPKGVTVHVFIIALTGHGRRE